MGGECVSSNVHNNNNNVEKMWEPVKWTMVGSAREVCGSVRGRGENLKSVWCNDEVKAAVKEKGGCLEGGIGS